MTNKFNNTAIAALLAAMGFSAPALAAMVGTGGFNTELHKMGMMQMLDGNGDHMVTNQEFASHYGEIFDELDTDHDGTLNSKEWAGVKGRQQISLATGGYSRELRKTAMMKAMDADGDHQVSKDEFVQFHQTIFTAMDKNGDQQLDPQEWLARQVGK